MLLHFMKCDNIMTNLMLPVVGVCVTSVWVSVLYIPPPFLLHFFNQQQKKDIFWVVCQQCPATTPLQLQPTLSPIRCNCQIKTLQISKRTDVHSHSLLHVLTTHPPPFFHPFSLPIVHFLISFFLKSVQALINFSLLIFVCISCFVLLDVLIKLIWFRFCFALHFLC